MIKKLISYLVMSSMIATTLPVSAETRIKRVEFKEADIRDTARILATLSGANIAVTKEASDAKVDLLLQNVDVKHAVEMISRVSGLWYRYNKANNSYLIMTEKQYQDDIVVYRDDIIKSFTLKHQNVTATALTIQSLYGDRVILKLQKDLDDFSGIPSDYLETIQDLTSTSGKSNDNRVTVNNINSNNRGGNANYATKNNGDVSTLQSEETTQALIHEEVDNSQLSTTQLKQIQSNGSEQIDADAQGRKLGIKTPIFIATNNIHNLMFVRTSDERALAEIEELIKESDKPTPQVLLETKILRITEGDSYTQDFDFSYNSALNVPGAYYDNGTTISDIFSGDATIKLEDNMSVNNMNRIIQQYLDNSVREAGFDAITGGFYQYYSKFVNAKIELLEETNRAEVIAKPILLASNNRPSRLFIGEDQVIATGLDGGSTTTTNAGNTSTTSTTKTELETEVRKVGNTLALLPSVNEDGTVTIDILQSTSELNKQGMEFPFYNEKTSEIDSVLLDTIKESTLKTIVVAKDGLTIALGGMINKIDSSERSTVPVLGDIPILGQMFQGKKDVEADAQYIMLITPHIITNPHEAQAKTEELEELDYGRFNESTRAAERALAQQEHVPERLSYITQAHAKPAGAIRTPVPASTLIRLNRHAARYLKGKPVKDKGITQGTHRIADLSALSSNPMLSIRPRALFRLEDVYLSVLEVTNQSDDQQVLPIDLVQGDWLSVSRTSKILMPFNDGAKRMAYLMVTSRKPLTESIFKK